ncbi:uncharacterized protein LOC135700430 isoform X2 [Ochlerotatus camptorhynchus]|uniref:uncharacterized protein LOC135700430 isoform X2 n=1 Tax=Ochlerotatus camptorhynchus TaxID=644619 RepID=UPI0031E2CDB4
MQIASIDSHIGSGLRIYFYCFTVLLLGVLMNSVKVVSVAAAIDDHQTYGTVLYNRLGRCFNPDDPRLIEAKRIFQDLMPYRKKRFEPLSDEVIKSLLLYFSSVGSMVDKLVAKNDVIVAAWYDTAGDYLQSYLYPVCKYCFYSGNVSYYSVRSVRDYYRKVKLRLDTDGFGWSRPNLDATDAQSNVQVLKSYQNRTNCSELIFNATTEIPLPKAEFDDETQEVISLWVPLKARQVYDPRANASLSILKIYVGTILHCIPHGKQTNKFATHFIQWIEENFIKHYMDDQFYPGLESILRIKKTLEADIAAKSIKKKSITEHDEESGSKGFLESLLGSDESAKVEEDYEDEQEEDERRWLRIKTLTATVIFALFLLVLIVVISVKLRMNRKAMKRKAATRSEHFKPWDRKKFFKRRGDQSDEDVLLMLEKQPGRSNPSETSESGWKHVKPQKLERKSQKPGTSKQIPPFSDTEDDEDFNPFQPKQHSAEKIPLIAKDDRKKKGRCGRGCLCMSCVKKSKNGNGHQDLQNSSAYKLANEKLKKVDPNDDVQRSKVEQPATIKPTTVRNLRGGNIAYRTDTWNDG